MQFCDHMTYTGLQGAFLHKRTEVESTCSLHSTSMPNFIQPHPLNPHRLATLESRDETEEVSPAPLTAEELVVIEEEKEQLTDSGIVTSGDGHVAPPSCPSPLPVSLPVDIPHSTPSRPNSLNLGLSNSFPVQRRATHSRTPSPSSTTLRLTIGLGAIFGIALCSYLSGR